MLTVFSVAGAGRGRRAAVGGREAKHVDREGLEGGGYGVRLRKHLCRRAGREREKQHVEPALVHGELGAGGRGAPGKLVLVVGAPANRARHGGGALHRAKPLRVPPPDLVNLAEIAEELLALCHVHKDVEARGSAAAPLRTQVKAVLWLCTHVCGRRLPRGRQRHIPRLVISLQVAREDGFADDSTRGRSRRSKQRCERNRCEFEGSGAGE
mmetsp:Transcript_5419/g.16153  ORF Transcript_5419/g.16153 Transcript_5419/m.16153 type:complete len:211 (+) Transcript_5419:1-633(+)